MSSRESAETVAVECRFYAGFRDAVGQKSVSETLPQDATVGDALAAVAEEHPDLDDVLFDDGAVRDAVAILRNGREGADLDAGLEDGDTLTLTNPVHGG